MGTETNSSLDTVTEQVSPHFFTDHIFSTQHYQFVLPVLAFKDLYIQTKLCNKFLKKLFHNIIWTDV